MAEFLAFCSARVPSLMSMLYPVAIGAILIKMCLALGLQWQSLAAVTTPLLLAAHGLHTSKLTRGGAYMATVVGWLLLAAGLKYFITVMAFYALGSAATKFRSGSKMGIVCEGGGGLKAYGQRSAQQVAIKGDGLERACFEL